MNRLSIFVDGNNMFYAQQKNGWFFDPRRVLRYFTQDPEIMLVNAFWYTGLKDPQDQRGFRDALILDAAVAGILALGLNYGAYMTEIFRAGIQSVSGGQGEAADALGMTYGQKMRKVVLPQAMRVIIPPTGNEFIAMMKDTALVSFLGVTVASAEIFRRSQLLGRADNRPLEALIVAAAIYWAMTAIFTFFQRRLETRISKGYTRESMIQTRHKPVTATGETTLP